MPATSAGSTRRSRGRYRAQAACAAPPNSVIPDISAIPPSRTASSEGPR